MHRARWNPRQRRGAVLILLAAVGAGVVFASVDSYVTRVRTEVGPVETALRLLADVRAFEPISPADIETVAVPRRWLPATAVRSPAKLTGKVASTDLDAGSYLQSDMVTTPPEIGPDQRAVTLAVPIGSIPAEVRRGSSVDVVASFGNKSNPAARKETRIVVNDARVVAREDVTRDGATVARLTFALGVKAGLALSYAEGFATDVKVVAVGYGSVAVPPGDGTYGRWRGGRHG